MKFVWEPKLLVNLKSKQSYSESHVLVVEPYHKIVGLQLGGRRPDKIELDYNDLKQLLMHNSKDQIISYLLTLQTSLAFPKGNDNE